LTLHNDFIDLHISQGTYDDSFVVKHHLPFATIFQIDKPFTTIFPPKKPSTKYF
jgi:hypothetical protein